MIKFKTIEEANTANELIGAEIQRVGRLENIKYVCQLWATVTEEDGYFCLPYNELADKLNIDYTT